MTPSQLAAQMAKLRAASLTPERRKEIASKAAKAKWAKLKTKKQRRAAVEPAAKARRAKPKTKGE